MKLSKYHAKRPFHPGVEIFSFQPDVKVRVSQKNFTLG